MEEKIKAKLDELRVGLQADGGDLELVKIEGKVVYLKLVGHCGSCPFAMMTLQQGIEAGLQEIDPETAARLHLSDQKRIIRALEIYLETGETMTAHNQKTQAIPPRYSPVWFGLDFEERSQLYDRIDRRVGIMLEQGLVQEIQSLLSSGISAKCTAMQAIGYKEFVSALSGYGTIEEAADLVRQSSRRYAKRQLTWFRRNNAMHWLIRNPNRGTDEILEKARRIIQETDK